MGRRANRNRSHRRTLILAFSLLAALPAPAETGSEACAPCHRQIYDAYRKTGMARSSGRTGDGLERTSGAAFRHAGAEYSVTSDMRVRYRRGALSGERSLDYFIGSGAVGRSYASILEGFLFQAPASYFAARASWGLSPGFQASQRVELARPIEAPCLSCHATGPRPTAGTANGFPDPPYAEAGIGCERCHGSGDSHVAGHGPIVNPAKLPAAQRDSICLQCHLTGAARVALSGKGPLTFRPGDVLWDHVAVFLRDGNPSERAATDHAEQLARSRCYQESQQKLWCGGCHDVHTGATRANSCQSCHPASHPGGGADCAGCHMPKGRSREGEHVVYTDHTIARRPRSAAQASAQGPLRPYPGTKPGEREWALAEPAARKATLAALAARPNADAAVLVQLAQLEDVGGNARQAVALYERALRLEPLHPIAQANLGIYRMQAGRAAEAITLWESAFTRNPSMVSAGLNLAAGLAQSGNTAAAVKTLERLLRFHPDLDRARQMLRELR